MKQTSSRRSGPQARSWDRAVLEALVAGSGLQIAVLLSTAISLPFVTRALSNEEYGVYATLVSLVALFAYLDLGVGSALTTRLTQAPESTGVSAQTSISSAVLVIGIAGAIPITLGVPAGLLLPWTDILGADSVPPGDLAIAVVITSVCTGLGIIGSLGYRVLYGVRRGGAVNAFMASGVLAAAGLSVGVALVGAPVYAFVAVGAGVPAVTAAGAAVWTLWLSEAVPAPSWRALSMAEVRGLLTAGGWFFAIAAASALGYQTDVLVVSVSLGASEAAIFNIALALFAVITQSLYPALLQLWPAFGDAYQRGDVRWLRSRLRVSTLLAVLLSGVLGGVLVVGGQWLIGVWLTDGLVPPRSLLLVLALWTSLALASAPMMILLNATGLERAHAVMAIAVGLANLPLSIVLAGSVGSEGPIVASIVAQTVLLIVPGGFYVARFLRRIEDPAFVRT